MSISYNGSILSTSPFRNHVTFVDQDQFFWVMLVLYSMALYWVKQLLYFPHCMDRALNRKKWGPCVLCFHPYMLERSCHFISSILRNCWDTAMATAAEVAGRHGSLGGKVYMVTGCSNGIGLECAKALYAAGGTVVMACRSGSKSARAQEEILSLESGDRQKRLHLLDVDLGNWTSVEKCAQAFIGLNLPLDCLICNAGINGVPTWGLYTPGVETQFAVNVLGHYHLATLLDGKLRSTANSRLVIVSSETHRRVSEKGFDLERELPPREQNYKDLHAYAFSNLCRTLWARALATKVPYPVVSVHPGLSANTGMLQHMGFGAFVRQIWCVLRWEPKSFFTLQSLPQVAATQTWAAVEPVSQLAALSGAYLNGNAGKTLGVPDTPSELAQREELAEKVVEYAEQYFAARVERSWMFDHQCCHECLIKLRREVQPCKRQWWAFLR